MAQQSTETSTFFLAMLSTCGSQCEIWIMLWRNIAHSGKMKAFHRQHYLFNSHTSPMQAVDRESALILRFLSPLVLNDLHNYGSRRTYEKWAQWKEKCTEPRWFPIRVLCWPLDNTVYPRAIMCSRRHELVREQANSSTWLKLWVAMDNQCDVTDCIEGKTTGERKQG